VGFGGQYGYYTDNETGLLCLTHRYYDPGTGKFINRDPIGYAGGENLYGFADGNPVNESDPSGFSSIEQVIHGINSAAEGLTQTVEAGTSTVEAGAFVVEAGADFIGAGAIAIGHTPGAIHSVAVAVATSTYRQLRQAGLKEKHHIIQNAAVRGLLGYNYHDAPAVQRDGPSADRTTEHGLTRIIQQQIGGGNFAAEVRIAYKALRRSGMQLHEARAHIRNAEAYFHSISVGPHTITEPVIDRRTEFRRGLRR
jgi:RHS repeat-associated protein